ncbi:MAG TPA: RNA polymerase factor sigma-54 [Planctomycetia bacterium]|jgi:RNA polymerase sigma-54 factor|nr:RNA polymerase factor sigma-54 [Planctomycetia bacterium]
MSIRMDLSQSMRMRQEMRLAPRMIQSMEILQLPALALEERIREEVEQNPVLEMGASVAEIASTDLEARFRETPEATPAQPGHEEVELSRDERKIAREREAFERMYEESGDNYIPSHQPSRWAGMELSDKKQDAMANMADRPAALAEHLLQQLVLQEGDPTALKFAEFLIANLDERGFLAHSLDDLVVRYEDPLTGEQAEEGLAILQQLDPPGVGARDTAECLLIQLDDPDPAITHVKELRLLLMRHWDDLLHRRLPAIEKKTGYSPELIREILGELRVLDANPGSKFTAAATQYVVPDLSVEKSETGDYEIRIHDESTPDVFISPQYVEALKQNNSDEKAKEYIRKKVTQARWLIEAIEQRRNTLKKVATAIVEHQRDFLDRGPEHLEPLKMQQIADRVGVHVTTVSRAVDDKWIETPRGVFPLKRFFANGTVTGDGKEVAYEEIRRKMEDLIAGEDKKSPLSDDDLEARLSELGYPIKRRTVTKYRKMLGIASSRERKEF